MVPAAMLRLQTNRMLARLQAVALVAAPLAISACTYYVTQPCPACPACAGSGPVAKPTVPQKGAPSSSSAASTPATSSGSPAAPIAPAAATTASADGDATIIHRAEIHGRVVSHSGSSLKLTSMVMTNKTPPPVGQKGVLLRKSPAAGEIAWVPFVDATVTSTVDENNQIVVSLPEEADAKALKERNSYLFTDSVVRFRWEW